MSDEPPEDEAPKMGVLKMFPGGKQTSEWNDASKMLRAMADRCDKGEINAVAIVAMLPDASVNSQWALRNTQWLVPLLGGVEAFKAFLLSAMPTVVNK